MTRAALCLAILAVAGCDDQMTSDAHDASAADAAPQDAAPQDAAPQDASGDLELALDELRATHAGASLHLKPAVRLDGVWRGAGRDGPCVPSELGLSCPAGEGVSAVARLEASLVRAGVVSAAPLSVEGLALTGTATLPGATGFVSNGFQSWSQTGVLAFGAAQTDAQAAATLAVKGDAEVVRTGQGLSYWHTLVGGGPVALFAGATDAQKLVPYQQISGTADALSVRFACGLPQDPVPLTDGALWGEPYLIALGEAEALQRRFAAELPARRAGARAEAGWNSWYELWDGVSEEAVRANATRVKALLGDALPDGAPPLRVVVDDGWQRGWGDWQVNDKFPSGLAGLTRDLKAQGFEVGVWLAPLLVAADRPLVSAHPDWFVEGAVYPHLKNGPMRVLDPTHPEAAAHLKQVITDLKEAGLTFIKIDFLFAGTWPGGRHEAVTGLQSYHRALALIREAAGPELAVLAVGAPPTPSLPYVDAWRVGNDIAVEPFGPSWPFLPNQLRSVASRWPYCLATLCDADPPILRTLPPEEVETGAWIVAVAGGAFFLSDDLRVLPAERAAFAAAPERLALALSGQPSYPLDLFPALPPSSLANPIADHVQGVSHQVAPRLYRLPDGRRLAINIANVEMVQDGHTIPPHQSALLDP